MGATCMCVHVLPISVTCARIETATSTSAKERGCLSAAVIHFTRLLPPRRRSPRDWPKYAHAQPLALPLLVPGYVFGPLQHVCPAKWKEGRARGETGARRRNSNGHARAMRAFTSVRVQARVDGARERAGVGWGVVERSRLCQDALRLYHLPQLRRRQRTFLDKVI